ncbi:Manganese transport regulator [Limihaloglobus sulfuriphilus]|uniref:Transcriptional regulator MntR n=1 Tax=Limihaloglobus sulfuriphilus TaxID=1851148 RepID=A0A1Q2ME05_9BACT|nr:DtxR family transcriptional regulator [Limihaloglobus sulfuriphilus]AQQ70900.1 Manganese transport regulator [Limihaloglobus sulfuriphilus]
MIEQEKIKLSASLEDYLEAIFFIQKDKGAAKPRDIAERLDVKAASVTGALQSLAEKELVNYAPYDAATLTETGKTIAEKIIRRHRILSDFFTLILGADKELAEENACKLEHHISRELLEDLVEFVEFTAACPRGGEDWIEKFRQRCTTKEDKDCVACIEECLPAGRRHGHGHGRDAQLTTLKEILPGMRCVVQRVKFKKSITHRLIEMGIGRGTIIEVVRTAPFGDPIEIKVKGYRLSIRKQEAENIHVQIL